MIKIAITIRNRLAITKKCILALKKHSKLQHQIYLFNNLTNHLLKEHFEYTYNLLNQGLITQATFNTPDSTFKAFSKATSLNAFGLMHEQDPQKDSYFFLVFLDNDVIVTPGWDEVLYVAWKYVNSTKLANIKVITQLRSGMKCTGITKHSVAGHRAHIGSLGGSALWSTRSNFFRDVGFINLRELVNYDKRHDQIYWRLMGQKTQGKDYILGLETNLGYHCGPEAGSICNVLTKHRKDGNKLDIIKFEAQEENIEKLSFDEFYKMIKSDPRMNRGW